MPEGPSLVVNGKRCQLHYFTGKVLSSQKQKETQVHSQSYGTQNNPQVSVTSTTVDHHEFFLTDAGGQERAFKMIDFDFPCREGQTLTVVWAIPEGTDFGPYVAVRNHNTGEYHVIDPKNITWMFKTSKWLMWGSMLGALVVVGYVVNFIVGVLALLVPAVYFKWREKQAAKALVASHAVRQLDAQLAQLKPLPA